MTATIMIPAQRQPDPADRWEIVIRAQAGDMEAFGLLYKLYQSKIHAFIWRRTSSKDLADDLTQDVFVRALRNLGGLSWQGRDIGAWLTTVARNIVADHFKSGRHRFESGVRYVTVGGSAGDEDAVDMVDVVDSDRRADPEQVAVHNAFNAVLDAALAQLKPPQREVLALRFGVGLSVAETAAAMGKEEGAIKALTYRATRAMAGLLREAGEEPC